MTSLINKRKVKSYALEVAKERFHKFTRVSPDFLIRSESYLKEFVRKSIQSLPSKGRTIK